MTLFELEPVFQPDPPPTAGAKMRARQQRRIDRGGHPLNHQPLLIGPSLTCGDCRFREVLRYHTRSYPKCAKGPRTHGPGTDVKASWPACVLFERADG